jgi:D-arabinose 1-dehydrogenase-like Zn-dependent alcohol dehydrogenase
LRAAVLHAFGVPLALTEVPDPDPFPDEVLVEVRAVGICGTDLKITAGAFRDTPLPLIPGHEVAGVLAEKGGDLARGQRVACHIYDACGQCSWCTLGQETLCPGGRRIGFDRDGGLARYLSVRRRNVFPFSEGVPFAQAAVTMDAVVSTWRALKVRASVARGEHVVVAGAGGLGLNAVQVGRALGARVAVIDPLEDHRQLALELGADLAVSPQNVAQIIDWSGGGASVGLEASGTRSGFDAAARSLRPGARLVCNGYQPLLGYGLDSSDLVLREMTILGSRNGSRADACEALRAVEAGLIRPPVSETFSLEEVNLALDRLKAGRALGRLVILP